MANKKKQETQKKEIKEEVIEVEDIPVPEENVENAEEEIAAASPEEGGQPEEQEEPGFFEEPEEPAKSADKKIPADELEKILSACEDYKRKWYAVSAEYDNYRKRNSQAVSRAYADGVAEAVLKLLPVADNFGYALSSASDEKTKSGIEKVIKSFNTILASLGVEPIEISHGDLFDESVAEAVMNVPCEDGDAPNTVKQVLKKGYREKSGGKVLRFAQVIVTI